MVVAEQNHAVFVIIHREYYQISEHVLNQVFSPFGGLENIQRVDYGSHFYWRIQFQTQDSALRAIRSLWGRCIYAGCCSLEVFWAPPPSTPIVSKSTTVVAKPAAVAVNAATQIGSQAPRNPSAATPQATLVGVVATPTANPTGDLPAANSNGAQFASQADPNGGPFALDLAAPVNDPPFAGPPVATRDPFASAAPAAHAIPFASNLATPVTDPPFAQFAAPNPPTSECSGNKSKQIHLTLVEIQQQKVNSVDSANNLVANLAQVTYLSSNQMSNCELVGIAIVFDHMQGINLKEFDPGGSTTVVVEKIGAIDKLLAYAYQVFGGMSKRHFNASDCSIQLGIVQLQMDTWVFDPGGCCVIHAFIGFSRRGRVESHRESD